MSPHVLRRLQRTEHELRAHVAAANRLYPETFNRRDYFDPMTLCRRFGWRA